MKQFIKLNHSDHNQLAVKSLMLTSHLAIIDNFLRNSSNNNPHTLYTTFEQQQPRQWPTFVPRNWFISVPLAPHLSFLCVEGYCHQTSTSDQQYRIVDRGHLKDCPNPPSLPVSLWHFWVFRARNVSLVKRTYNRTQINCFLISINFAAFFLKSPESSRLESALQPWRSDQWSQGKKFLQGPPTACSFHLGWVEVDNPAWLWVVSWRSCARPRLTLT